jgi:S1-C subfamily serine protease
MNGGSTRVWHGALAVIVAAVLVVGLTSVVAAGSKDAEKKGYLGVYMQKLDSDVREGLDLEVQEGVLISGVEEGGPADEAGIRDGDVIIEFAGKKIASPDDLRDLAQETEVGEEVKVKVIRDGKAKTLTLVVGEWPDDFGWMSINDFHSDWDDIPGVSKIIHAFSPKPRLGVEVTELNDDLAPYFKTRPGEGVLVLEVNEESVAEEAGVKSGDVTQGQEDQADRDDGRASQPIPMERETAHGTVQDTPGTKGVSVSLESPEDRRLHRRG